MERDLHHVERGRLIPDDRRIASYPASFRAMFKKVEGTWSGVTPTETGTLITIRFDGEKRPGPLGALAVAAMGRDGVLNGILDGYQAQISHRLAADQTIS